MKKIIIIFLFIITSCSTNKVVNNHGTLALEKKLDKISLNISNINDVITVLGPPSTKSTFDGNIWMYIERKKANQSIFMLGKKKVIKNNVLLVQFNNQGMLINKEFYNINDLKKINFDKDITEKAYDKKTFISNIFSSFREKINAPVKKRKKK
tara:strand:+ start:331 stop:789 length:459 start_codon:yes stop_codon:yes gene_type:complete